MLSCGLSRVGLAVAFLGCSAAVALSAGCPPTSGTLGTSRVMRIKPADFPLVGKLQYKETLRLKDREVVLTFGDGPYAPYTAVILDALAAECVKATFFLTGNAVVDAPDLVRRAYNEGHTIGTHTFGGESLGAVPFERAKEDIDKGIAAAAEALGSSEELAPFFRAPDLEISKQAERYVLSKGLMIWSGDVDSEDWAEPTEEQFVAKAIAGLEEQGKGILLIHDNQPVAARAMRQLLAELKMRKFKIVHVVSAQASTTVSGVKER
jgi:peptidoglycan/xylan/chitin deacetylase (PgdA/CDA1 family)